MRILDNVSALRVYTNLTRNDRSILRSTTRLSSGFRINNAGDDPAGFSIATGLRWQVSSKQMADRNTLDATSLLETADAALQDIQNMVHRIRELAVAAANDTNSPENRQMTQNEVNSLLEEIDAITGRIEFNNIRLLNGEAQDLKIQIGGREGMRIALNIPSFKTTELGLYGASVSPSHTDAQDVINRADAALTQISSQRSFIGANINRMEYTSSSLQAASEATSRSLSRIVDTDMAWEMMELSTANILSQAGMAIMSQVNQRPQQLLQLLG